MTQHWKDVIDVKTTMRFVPSLAVENHDGINYELPVKKIGLYYLSNLAELGHIVIRQWRQPLQKVKHYHAQPVGKLGTNHIEKPRHTSKTKPIAKYIQAGLSIWKSLHSIFMTIQNTKMEMKYSHDNSAIKPQWERP